MSSCQKLITFLAFLVLEKNDSLRIKRCELKIAEKIGRKSAKFVFLRPLIYIVVIVIQIILD